MYILLSLMLRHSLFPEYPAHVVECAYNLRHFGDRLYWRYKLLEMLLHYKNIIK